MKGSARALHPEIRAAGDDGAFTGSVKNGSRPADAILMPRGRGWDESPRTSMLRKRYRCERCYKGCLIPCRFTAAEFRQMERESDEATPDEGSNAGESTDCPRS